MLLTRSPLSIAAPFDLHVLGTPPAFILSQDQTLHKRRVIAHLSSAVLPPRLGFSFSACPSGHAPESIVLSVSVHSAVVKVAAFLHADTPILPHLPHFAIPNFKLLS